MAADLMTRADVFVRRILAEEREEEDRLRRIFHLHVFLIGCAFTFVLAGTFGLMPSDYAACCVVGTEWCRAGVDHRSEVRVHHD